LSRNVRSAVIATGSFAWLSLSILPCAVPALAQSQQPPVVRGADTERPNGPGTAASPSQQSPDEQLSGSVSGTVVDPTGAVVAGARVNLTRENQSPSQGVLSGEDGQFSFANIAPGPFQLTISAPGFATQSSSGTLRPGESHEVPQIVLAVATAVTEVKVVPPQIELAELQIKEEEKQRVLGFIPNFYVSYVPNAAPLTSKQKFELAWRITIDPISFALIGASAGVGQALNQFGGYGQGAGGYGKRYGAVLGDSVSSTFIGSAILPSLLKQDPRYFYRGTGSKRSRFLYAVANAVICKGDNGHWQTNYSNILGSLAAGGISNAYYPAKDRNGAGLTFENTLIGIGTTAATNLLQEFVIRKFTPNVRSPSPPKP